MKYLTWLCLLASFAIATDSILRDGANSNTQGAGSDEDVPYDAIGVSTESIEVHRLILS